MFWLGLAISLISGLVGIGVARDFLKRKLPRFRDAHLDLMAIALLIAGLSIAAFDYRDSEAARKRAEEAIARQQPRSITTDQRAILLKLLSQGAKGPVIVQADWTDAEAGKFAEQIQTLLTEAGFDVKKVTLQVLAVKQQGVFMFVKNLGQAPRHAFAIQNSFATVKIPLNAHKVSAGMERGIVNNSKADWEFDLNTVAIWVGQKPLFRFGKCQPWAANFYVPSHRP